MSDADVKNAEGASGVDGDETEPNYKPPEQKSLSTILDQDKEDEALEKYKKQLLGKILPLNLNKSSSELIRHSNENTSNHHL